MTSRIDQSQTIELRQHVPPQVRRGVDQGTVEGSFALESVTLVFKISPEQQRALDQLLTAQQNPSSPDYHHWLSSEEFGERFGLAREDMARIREWLGAQGLRVIREARGRDWIDFTGTAEQVGRAFHTEIHRYSIDGKEHFANTGNPAVPRAMADVVLRLSGLDDFRPAPPNHHPATIADARPEYTNLSSTHYLAPDDIAAIYDITPLYGKGYDGTGQQIVILGQAAIGLSEIAAFRSIFNLPSLTPFLQGYGTGTSDWDDVSEAIMDIEWAGAVARNATIIYAYSNNVFDALRPAIDANLAPVISSSYTVFPCDRTLVERAGTNGPVPILDGLRQDAQKANALGITWVSAAADTGAAGCDPNVPYNAPAIGGYGVAAPASVPEVTAVGGTEFDEGSGSYWNYWNGNNQGSATAYIPEKAWNDSDSTGLRAGGGGQSAYYATPWWQIDFGLPTGGRFMPDISLAASAAHDAYITCVPIANCPPLTWKLLGPNAGFLPSGGTSAATPTFAGILALLNQYLAANGGQSRLGNINPTLYWLFPNYSSAFHDITNGSNIVPCLIGSPGCQDGFLGFNVGNGYDEATGLGSVDAYRLITTWATLVVPHIDSIAPSVPSAEPQLQTVTVNGSGFQSPLTVVATFPSNTGSSTLQGQIRLLSSTAFQMSVALNTAGSWNIQAFDANGRPSNLFSFTVNPAVQAPTVTTSAASLVTSSSVTMSGLVNPIGSDSHVWFQYSTNSSMAGSLTTAQQDAGSGTGSVPFSAPISGLTPGTMYYFRAWGSNSGGSSYGSILTFATPSSARAPAVVTATPSALTAISATFGGTVNPNGFATSAWFLYAVSSSMVGATGTPLQNLGSGSTAVALSAPAAGLTPGATYYVQAWASSSAGTSQGAVVAFSTPPGPVVSTVGATSITSASAMLEGSVTVTGTGIKVWFQYSTSSSMTSAVSTPQQSITPVSGALPFSRTVSGLTASTTYYFQAWASSWGVLSAGAVQTFSTPAAASLPGVPVPLTPADKSTNVSLTPTLTWSAASNATGYTVCFGTTNPPAPVLAVNSWTQTTYVPGELIGGATYYWKVIATNAVGSTSSATISFTTAPVSGVVLASGLGTPIALALDGTSVYWKEGYGGTVRKIAKAGGTPVTLYTSVFQLPAGGLVVDDANVYFTDAYSRAEYVPKAGGAAVALPIAGNALAVDANNVYGVYSAISSLDYNYDYCLISGVAKSGGASWTIQETAGGHRCGSYIATDGVSVYWVDSGNGWVSDIVQKAPVNGGPVTALNSLTNVTGLVLDPTKTSMDVLQQFVVYQISTAPTSGSPVTILAGSGYTLPAVADLATDGTSVFWVEDLTSTGALLQVPAGGGTPITLTAALSGPVAVAVDDTYVYWIENNNNSAGTLKRLPKTPVVRIMVGTNPSGLSFQVDGVSYNSEQNFLWVQGSAHTISTTATQALGSGTQNVWQSWSDVGQTSHTVTAISNAAFTANFGTQFYLTTASSAGGTVSPASGWYVSGAVVNIAAAASNGFTFTGFSGNLTGTLTPQKVVMTGPVSVSAAFGALSVAKSHTGNFSQGQNGATYSITVSSAPGASPTSGTVTVTESVPAGVTLVSMSGTGWTCASGGNTCVRSDALPGGSSYPPITVTANIASNAAAQVTNQATVSGGGSAPNTASDVATVLPVCSFSLTPAAMSLPATGTSTPAACPDAKQPTCGFTPEGPISFTVTPSAVCGAWTATSSDPFVQVSSGTSGSGAGIVTVTVLANTHTVTRNATITVASGPGLAPFSVAETGSADSQLYRETYALYEQLLGRDPDSSGFAFWTGPLGVGLGQIADLFMSSPESFGTNFAVMAAYKAATGAPPNFAQFTAALMNLRAGTQTVGGFFGSLINGSYTASNLYQNLLGRAPTTGEIASANNAGLPSWFQTLIGYPVPAGATTIGAANNEFQSTGSFHVDHTNTLYLPMIYFLILGRDLDPSGLAFWINVANSGGPGVFFQGSAGLNTRILILGSGAPNEGFIGSPEFQGLFAN